MPTPKEEKTAAVPEFAPLEKIFQYLSSLHGRIDHAKGLLERFQKEFRDLDDEDRGILMAQAYGIMRIVINDLLAFARTRGEEDELRDELAASIANVREESYEADYERILQFLLVGESQLEIWQMLLTNQPVPTDWAAGLWDEMLMETRDAALKEYVEAQRGRAKEALEKSGIPEDAAGRLEKFVMEGLEEDLGEDDLEDDDEGGEEDGE